MKWGMAEKLSRYVKRHLSAKKAKVRADNPELEHKAVLGRAIGILRGEEEKLSFSKDVRRRERRGH